VGTEATKEGVKSTRRASKTLYRGTSAGHEESKRVQSGEEKKNTVGGVRSIGVIWNVATATPEAVKQKKDFHQAESERTENLNLQSM